MSVGRCCGAPRMILTMKPRLLIILVMIHFTTTNHHPHSTYTFTISR